MISNKVCPLGSIDSVTFNILGDESIKKLSSVTITTDDLNKDNGPYPGGMYDAHLGTLDYGYKCLTCMNTKKSCIGHSGHMNLNYPIWNPLFSNEGRKWLKIICHNRECHKIIIADSVITQYPLASRFAAVYGIVKTGNKKCVHCHEPHYVIKKDKQRPLILKAEKSAEGKIIDTKILYPHNIKEILYAITDDKVLLLGKPLSCHPKNSILTTILVPPVNIRPETKRSATLRNATTDDLTITLQIINKKNSTIPAIVDNINDKMEKLLTDINSLYIEYVKSTKDGSILSLTKRIKGKPGHLRKNILGKRVFKMCRTTIVGDSSREIDEIGIPLIFARTVQICEVLQDYNRHILMQYIKNGTKKYPGATRIFKRSTNTMYDVTIFNDELENGDIVYRDIIDGDVVGFNRQPSLAISNIGIHKVKVILDPEIKTISMNVMACPLYNADFDGDQMNMIIYSSAASRSEVSFLSSVPNWLISHTTSNPMIGQVDDSIIGLAELTMNTVKLDKYHAMLLFGRTSKLPSFGSVGKSHITGRDCISAILDGMNINFTRSPSWYNANYAHIIKYDPKDIKVVIENGKHISGILDKASIGKGAKSGLFDIICREYGPKQSLLTMFDLQQLAIAYNIHINGYTIGMMDILIPKETTKEINKIAADMINKSQLITDEFIRGEMIPPIGEPIASFYDKSQINALSSFGMFDETILKSIDHYVNNLFKLIGFASKGSLNNLYNINSVIGQRLINGERVSEKFGPSRTLPYFPRFDTNPIARGYSPNSYLSGMSPAEYIWGSMSARYDFISKALSTSIAGEMERQSIKCLETIVINNLLQSTKFAKIVQFMYGEDGIDVRNIEPVSFPTVMMSNESFDNKYKHPDFPDIYKQMTDDILKYRKIFLTLETTTSNDIMVDVRRLPVNIERVIKDVCVLHKDLLNIEPPNLEDLKEMNKLVMDFCDEVPYFYTNETQYKKKTRLPQYIYDAAWLMQMSVRSYLCPNMIIQHKINIELLSAILTKIKIKYICAISNPGTPIGIITAKAFCEPLVQYMLDAHHRSASGGTSKSGMTSSKEVLNAKPKDKLESSTMLIQVLPEYRKNKQKVQEIANEIEQISLDKFVDKFLVFYESYGNPVHPDYVHEAKIIRDFNKSNPLLQPPGDLINWCIRFELDRTSLILKTIDVNYIINKLRHTYPNVYIVYTSDNAKVIMLRIYMRSNIFKDKINENHVIQYGETLLSTIIRGYDGIVNTNVIEIFRSKVNDDGRVSQDSGNYAIATNGSNLSDIFMMSSIDASLTQTDVLQEIASVLGIEAARTRLIQQLRSLVSVCSHRHYVLYADEMTFTGDITGINLGGLTEREDNVLLHMGFSSPISSLENALTLSTSNQVDGVTAKFLVGSVPTYGTFYNQLQINPEVIRANIVTPNDAIDELFE